jgi:general secretion pathway protein D
MKTILLALTLVLTGFELRAQMPGQMPGSMNSRRPPRYGVTNGGYTQPRYQPAAPGATVPPRIPPPTGAPGGMPAPGAAPGAPGAPGGVPLSSAYNASSSFASQQDEMIAPGLIDFEGVELSQVLDIYAKLVNRTLLRAALPQAQIILKTQTPLTKTEAIEALQAVLALNGVSLINIGDKFVKVVPSDQAGGMGADIDRSGSTNIPALGSYVTHVVQLKYVKPSEMVPVIQPFSRLANSILPIDGNGILVLRDYAENVKRMLEMIEQVDVSVPAEYISEVIPIRYAKVDDIASALNALGGGGGATVSIGTAPGNSQISGFSSGRSTGLGGGVGGMGGMGGMGGIGGMGGGGISGLGGVGGGSYGGSSFGGGSFGGGNTFGGARPGTTPNGTPSGGTSFQDRLRNIINSTSGGSGSGAGGNKQDIQLFGQTKIIPNESSSSLLIYATRADMEVIKGIIAKLDVPLAQVLVEAAIIDYSLGPNTFNFGVSAAQNPVQNGQFIGGGGVNNSSGGSPFINFVQNITANKATNGLIQSISKTISTSTSGTNSGFGNNLPGGVSYFANIGPNWDVAMTAAASDSHASVIQRPRIQTSQAKPAQFFVGDTVPYVTGNSYGTAYGAGVSYSQLSVGVELDVTPFINPDGLVVMDIQQEIDDLNGYTTIDNVGQVPNTIKRTLNAEIAVRDRDTVMLGGFIKSNKSTSRSGVPFLMDIPILGNLFLQRNDSKQREELIVLMRPTVLPTPQLAAVNTLKEEQRLPGVANAEADNADEERKFVNVERKREMQKYKASHGSYEGFFTPRKDDNTTNTVPLDLPTPHASNAPQTFPGTGVEEVTPVPVAVHPQAGIATEPGSPAPANGGNPAVPPNPEPEKAAAPAEKK